MRIVVYKTGVSLLREDGDKALSHESTVTHHIRRLLREREDVVVPKGRWVRFDPSKVGLTSCKQGVINNKTGVCYWHERYQLEDAHKAFNSGAVFYGRGDTDGRSE